MHTQYSIQGFTSCFKNILRGTQQGRDYLLESAGRQVQYCNNMVTDLEVERVVPFPEAVVESHVQPGRPHTLGEVTDEVTLRPQVNTVPVPVVDAFKVTPALVVLGGQDDVCGDNGRGIGGRGTMGEEWGEGNNGRGIPRRGTMGEGGGQGRGIGGRGTMGEE